MCLEIRREKPKRPKERLLGRLPIFIYYTFNVPHQTAMAILRNILQSFAAGLVYCQLLVVFCCLFVHQAKPDGALAYETDSIKDGKPEPQIFQLTLGARVFFFFFSSFLSSPF